MFVRGVLDIGRASWHRAPFARDLDTCCRRPIRSGIPASGALRSRPSWGYRGRKQSLPWQVESKPGTGDSLFYGVVCPFRSNMRIQDDCQERFQWFLRATRGRSTAIGRLRVGIADLDVEGVEGGPWCSKSGHPCCHGRDSLRISPRFHVMWSLIFSQVANFCIDGTNVAFDNCKNVVPVPGVPGCSCMLFNRIPFGSASDRAAGSRACSQGLIFNEDRQSTAACVFSPLCPDPSE